MCKSLPLCSYDCLSHFSSGIHVQRGQPYKSKWEKKYFLKNIFIYVYSTHPLPSALQHFAISGGCVQSTVPCPCEWEPHVQQPLGAWQRHDILRQPSLLNVLPGRGEGTLRLMAIDGLHSNSQLNLHNEWQRLLTLLSLSMIAISSLLVSSDGTSDTLSVTFIVKATVVCKHQHLACTNLDIDVQC